MQGFGSVEKNSGSSGGGQSRCGLVSDNSRFAHPGDDNLALTPENEVGSLTHAFFRRTAETPEGILYRIDQLVKRFVLHGISLPSRVFIPARLQPS